MTPSIPSLAPSRSETLNTPPSFAERVILFSDRYLSQADQQCGGVVETCG